MMKAKQVKEAAKLIEQLEKLEAFLADAPSDADTLTLTLRKGSRSKSVSLNDRTTIVDLRKTVEKICDQTRRWVADMGVDID